jgi:phosphatidylserine/phosphatidylglycerophosphate/cardiolipin synthase-like enzyme
MFLKNNIRHFILFFHCFMGLVGTANMDFRSFELNFEMAAMIYGESICTDLSNTFMEDLKESTEIDPAWWKNRENGSILRMGSAAYSLPLR